MREGGGSSPPPPLFSNLPYSSLLSSSLADTFFFSSFRSSPRRSLRTQALPPHPTPTTPVSACTVAPDPSFFVVFVNVVSSTFIYGGGGGISISGVSNSVSVHILTFIYSTSSSLNFSSPLPFLLPYSYCYSSYPPSTPPPLFGDFYKGKEREDDDAAPVSNAKYGANSDAANLEEED